MSVLNPLMPKRAVWRGSYYFKVNYQVFQITFNNLIKDAKIEEFIAHPQKTYPIGVDIFDSFLLLAFPSDVVVNQIQYFGSSLSQLKREVLAQPFNYLVYYRHQDDRLTQWERENFDITNEYRVKNGISPFQYNKKANWLARTKSIDMSVNNYYEHESPFYGWPYELYSMFGIENIYPGENIMKAWQNNFSPLEAFDAWKNSHDHNENMLSDNKHMGVGCFLTLQGGSLWTQQLLFLDDLTISTFKYGDELVLENPYNMQEPTDPSDPSSKNNIFLFVGIAFLVVILGLVIGVIIALTIKKIKKQSVK